MRTLRAGVEWLTKDWRFTRHMPRDFGRLPIRVSTAGGLRYLFRSMRGVDPELLQLVHEVIEPGHCVWDIGANVGLFALAAAYRATARGHIVAIEADTWLVGLLRQTASLQDGSSSAPIEVLPAAIAGDFGVGRFCVARRARSSNHLQGFGHSQSGGVSETQAVITVTLDSLVPVLPRPDVIKIDVEGAELGVLRGASQLLRTHRPTVLCEVGEDSASAVATFLEEHDYTVVDAAVPRHQRRRVTDAVWSTLAIPCENQRVLSKLAPDAG